MTERLPYGITMESSHIATLHLTGLSKKARQIHIIPKMKTTSLILLGVLCDDEYKIKIDNTDMSVHKNGQETIECVKFPWKNNNKKL